MLVGVVVAESAYQNTSTAQQTSQQKPVSSAVAFQHWH
jgi:hypothetical protein